QPILYACPEIAIAVLIQIECPATKDSVVSIALDAALPNRAQLSRRTCISAGPERPFPILEERKNISSIKLCVLGELAVLPTCQPFEGANPQRPIARD